MPALSLIVPTCNRSARLASLLDALQTQSLAAEQYEVIIVDNASADDTRAVCGESLRSLPNARLVAEAEPGLHAARHRGWAEACGDILVYADDDIVPTETWLDALLGAFNDERVLLAGGPNLPSPEGEMPGWLERWWTQSRPGRRAVGYFSILDLGATRHPIAPAYVWGCNFAVRRHVLERSCGFHPDALPATLALRRGDGETWVADVVSELGGVALYVPGASVQHRIPAERMSLDFLKRRAYNQGLSDSFTVARAGSVDAWCKASRRRARLIGLMYMLKRPLSHLPGGGMRGRIRRCIHAASLRGYREHRAALRHDPELAAWVFREDYLAAELRDRTVG